MEHHFNQLSPAEAERLAFVLEEMGEVAQAIGKVLRHGYESNNPLDPFKITNRMKLTGEIGDLITVVALLIEAHDIDEDDVVESSEVKVDRLRTYHHHQPEELFK